MFARVFALLPLALLVSASHLEARDSCSTGGMYCCNSVKSVEDSMNYLTQNNLVAAFANVVGDVGFKCSPITVIGAGSGSSCTGQTTCCTGNTFNGLVTAGCNNINLPL